MHGQKPQKWLTGLRIAAFCLALISILAGGYIFIRGSLGSQTNLFTAIFEVSGVVVGLFQLIPLLKSSQAAPPAQPIPAPQPIHVHVHTTPEPISVTPTFPPPVTTIPTAYRGVAAQPPNCPQLFYPCTTYFC